MSTTATKMPTTMPTGKIYERAITNALAGYVKPAVIRALFIAPTAPENDESIKCPRGHLKTGDNLQWVRTRGGRFSRGCRQCRLEQVKASQKRAQIKNPKLLPSHLRALAGIAKSPKQTTTPAQLAKRTKWSVSSVYMACMELKRRRYIEKPTGGTYRLLPRGAEVFKAATSKRKNFPS